MVLDGVRLESLSDLHKMDLINAIKLLSTNITIVNLSLIRLVHYAGSLSDAWHGAVFLGGARLSRNPFAQCSAVFSGQYSPVECLMLELSLVEGTILSID